MANNDTTATRRAVLVALAGTAAFAGTIGAAIATPADAATPTGEPTPEGNRLYDEAFGHGFSEGGDIALLHVARAFVDRWQAAHGFFTLCQGEDGKPRVAIGWGEYGFTPRDGSDSALAPHLRITDADQCDGARRALEGMLTLVPGLREAVREIVGVPLLAREA